MNNIENVFCRLCAELMPHNKLFDLQTDEAKCTEIITKLTRFNVQMNFSDNVLPKMVCYSCINSLNRAFDFVTVVEKAQSNLNDFILTRQIKQEKNASDDDLVVYDSSSSYETDAEIQNIKVESNKKGKLTSKTSTQKKKTSSCRKETCSKVSHLSQLKLTWKSYNWLCTYCETQFPSVDELRTHSMQYHNACNPYRCTDCKIRKLRLDTFILHVRKHKRFLRFSCYKCSMVFGSVIAANKHKETHKTSDIVCFGCNMCFESQEELGNHTTTYFRGTNARKPRPPVQLQGNSLTCPICEKVCKTKTSLSTHLLIHTDRKKDHTCEVCGKCFFQKGSLAGHMLQHTDVKPFQCEICKSSFKTSRRLRQHIAIHDGGKPFSCDQCGKLFRLKRQLNNHAIIHTDAHPHVCTYCNKSFRFKTILNQHIRQHTGVKPYSCALCQRDFTNWSNYNKHMKRRHATDMAKKKRTPDGTYPIDPLTGEVIMPAEDKITEWKKKMMKKDS